MGCIGGREDEGGIGQGIYMAFHLGGRVVYVYSLVHARKQVFVSYHDILDKFLKSALQRGRKGKFQLW